MVILFVDDRSVHIWDRYEEKLKEKKDKAVDEYYKLGYILYDIKIWYDYYDEQTYDARRIKCITQWEQKHYKLYFKKPFKFFKVKIDS